MSIITIDRANRATWPRARTAWQLVSAEFLKVRKRRGLVALAVMLTAGAIAAAGAVLALLHAQDPAKYGPAGGLSNLANLANAAYMLSMLGAVAAVLTGATMGAGDLQAGVFRDLVATGRSRLALFAARIRPWPGPPPQPPGAEASPPRTGSASGSMQAGSPAVSLPGSLIAPAHTVPHRVAASALGAQIRLRRRLLLPGPGSGWRAVRRGVVMRVPARDRDESDGPVTAPATAGTAAGRSLPGRPAGRRPEFDVMRAFVVAGLVVFHSAVVFAAGTSWFVTDPRPSAGFTVFLLWGSLWGMPLLFLISGMGAQYAMRTRPAAAFARERLARLGIPFAAGLAVLVPPMFYLERLTQPAFHQSYWRFWLSFVNVPAIAAGLLPRGSWTSGGVTFDPAHLWFLYVLLLFTLALLPLFAYLRGPRGRPLIGRLAGFAERHGGVMVWAAAIPLMAVEAVFGPDVNTGGWERVTYVFPFLYGFLIACDSRFEAALRRSRWPALAVACAATVALVAWAGALSGSAAGLTGVPAGWSALQGLAGWAWTAAIMGFAGSVAARRGGQPPDTAGPPLAAPRPRWLRAARYANEAVLPFYLLHEPVIVAAAWLIVRWPAPIPAKYAVLVIMSFAATLGLYEALVRRFRVTRLLSGMKPRIKPATRHQAPPRTAEVDGSVGERVEIYSRLALADAQQRYDDVIATSRSDQHGHARGAGATRAGQTWVLTPDGYRLAGGHLPAPGDTGTGGAP